MTGKVFAALDKAVRDLEQSAEYEPDVVEVHILRGPAREDTGGYDSRTLILLEGRVYGLDHECGFNPEDFDRMERRDMLFDSDDVPQEEKDAFYGLLEHLDQIEYDAEHGKAPATEPAAE